MTSILTFKIKSKNHQFFYILIWNFFNNILTLSANIKSNTFQKLVSNPQMYACQLQSTKTFQHKVQKSVILIFYLEFYHTAAPLKHIHVDILHKVQNSVILILHLEFYQIHVKILTLSPKIKNISSKTLHFSKVYPNRSNSVNRPSLAAE